MAEFGAVTVNISCVLVTQGLGDSNSVTASFITVIGHTVYYHRCVYQLSLVNEKWSDIGRGATHISSICYYLPEEENSLGWTHEEKEQFEGVVSCFFLW